MRRVLPALLLAAFLSAPLAAQDAACSPPCRADGAIYIALYWKARPGMEADYERYIREVAQPIDDEAHRDGAFEELRTYVPDEPNGTWTHLRVFRLRDQAQSRPFRRRWTRRASGSTRIRHAVPSRTISGISCGGRSGAAFTEPAGRPGPMGVPRTDWRRYGRRR